MAYMQCKKCGEKRPYDHGIVAKCVCGEPALGKKSKTAVPSLRHLANSQTRKTIKRTNKWGNKKITIDGILFDSLAEGRRYRELVLMGRAGLIEDLVLQQKFVLQDGYRNRDGKKIREIAYFADFSYTDRKTGGRVVEDVKGKATKVFLLKQKMLLFRYRDLDFRLVKR